MSEIENIIEDEKERAFYIKLRDNKTYSKVVIDENPVPSKIFKVNGEQYDKDEFEKVYDEVRRISEAKVEVAEKKNWEDEDKKKAFLKITLPYIGLVIIAVVHIFVGMY